MFSCRRLQAYPERGKDASVIETVLGDHTLRTALAEQAGAHARTLYSAERMAEAYMGLYQLLAHRHGLAT
ncbi:MAG: hypothetical protein ACRDGS_07765 [Chloroflexota bacterium]